MAEQDQQYDPADHTVAEVNEYLSTADETERQRVLAAEQDGKARKGILENDDTDATADVYAVQPADQSAPEGASTDAADGYTTASYVDPAGDLTADRPATIQEQDEPTAEGDAYQRGYFGALPNEGDREDLTLGAVLARQNG